MPLKMTAFSLKDRFFHYPNSDTHKLYLNKTQDAIFFKELRRIESEHLSSDYLSTLCQDSTRNLFLYYLYAYGHVNDLEVFRGVGFSQFVDDLLDRSPERLARASSEWKLFSQKFFINRGRPVPDWAMYMEIQEELGIYGKSRLHRLRRVLKRKVQLGLKSVLETACLQYPQWKWATRAQCYLTAALSNQYKLPSGRYSC
jgi:hypothetical protein